MVHLVRFKGTMHGTQGMLFLPNGWHCCTMEPPWLNNERGRSCIPEGDYQVAARYSPKYGTVYHVKKVPGRTNILFHSGNYAGDEESGFQTDTDGCILLGESHGILSEQEAVLGSRVTIADFMRVLKEDPFVLTIKGQPEPRR